MFGKVVQNVAKEVKPVFRFNQGFQKMGFQVRPKDTRTTEEIKATIDYLIKDNKDLEGFKKELSTMQPEHLGLVADVLEISRRQEMLPVAINMNEKNAKTGKSLIQAICEAFPKASKENCELLDFSQEVINNTDTTTAKYFFTGIVDAMKNPRPELKGKFKAAKPMVKDIAESTLSGGYTMDYTPQENFVRYLNTLVNNNSKIDKLEILPEYCKVIDELPTTHTIHLDTFVNSSAPVSRVKDNMSVLKDAVQLYENQGKNINLSEFVTRNVNLR